jgi:GalNAc5-diNAcBac-PP-undecaprenol beta-1,3-glucosyltransferase
VTPLATVLIPTYDHGSTLYHSVRSALGQSLRALEVLVVGDGVPDATRGVMAELMREDGRVRFFDNPKGPRHGEVHRHAALAQARGQIVCYLSDDDLWFPDHVEVMQALLAGADFGHALPLRAFPDGAVGGWIVDLSHPFYRQLHLSGANRIPLSCAGHTTAAYRQLPYGWRTTPDDVPTDLYMWQQFLADPECRLRSGTWPTVVHFPSPERAGWTIEARCAELERWSAGFDDPAWRVAFLRTVLDGVVRERGILHADAEALAAVRRELDAVYGTATWRVRTRILSLPVLSRFALWAARALAGPTGR